MNNSVVQEIITRLEREFENSKSVEAKSILSYLIGLLRNNYLIKEKNNLEKFYIKGILQGIDSIGNDNNLKTFDDLYAEKN
jgi:hypothetical protein